MTRTIPASIALGCVVCCLSAGCDRPPSPPRVKWYKPVEFLAVAPGDAEELAAVEALEAARVNYHHRLEVLKGFYESAGNADKLVWVGREIKNLEKAQTFTWQDIEVVPPAGEAYEDPDEHLLVQFTIDARREYRRAVEDLAAFYEARGLTFKAQMIRNLQERFDPVRTYLYFLDAEIPGPDLKPTAVITEADELYDRALRLHEDGKGFLRTFLTTNYDKQRQALALFRELVHKYPTSNKVALAAFHIGEIYKEYFNENVRAANWYERAWTWDPQIDRPARFQAATVWDFRLQNKTKAIKCYQGAIDFERFAPHNVRYALQRIEELTTGRD